MRATAEEMFQMRAKMAAAAALLWVHDSHPSLSLSSQNLPTPCTASHPGETKVHYICTAVLRCIYFYLLGFWCTSGLDESHRIYWVSVMKTERDDNDDDDAQS